MNASWEDNERLWEQYEVLRDKHMDNGASERGAASLAREEMDTMDALVERVNRWMER